MQGIIARLTATTATAAALSLLLVASPVAAQDLTPPAPQDQPPDSVQEMMAEFQEKQQRLGTLQVQAIEENEELEDRRDQIGDMVNDAMAEADPEAATNMERMEDLEAQAMEAQEAQDMERLQEIINEAQGLQNQLQAAQNEAMQQETVQTEIQRFEADLMSEMMAIDPEAEELLERLDELAAVLNQVGVPGL